MRQVKCTDNQCFLEPNMNPTEASSGLYPQESTKLVSINGKKSLSAAISKPRKRQSKGGAKKIATKRRKASKKGGYSNKISNQLIKRRKGVKAIKRCLSGGGDKKAKRAKKRLT